MVTIPLNLMCFWVKPVDVQKMTPVSNGDISSSANYKLHFVKSVHCFLAGWCDACVLCICLGVSVRLCFTHYTELFAMVTTN